MMTLSSSMCSRETDTARLAEMIANDFYDARLDLSARGMGSGNTWSQMPEVECVQKLRAADVSEREVRLFLTFVSAMDRARDAVRLWRAGVKLFELHPQIFDPAEVSAMPFRTLLVLLSDSDVSQRHGPDSEAWRSIAGSLDSGSGSVWVRIMANPGMAKIDRMYVCIPFPSRWMCKFVVLPRT